MKIDRRKFLRVSAAALATAPVSACAGTKKVATEGVPRSAFDAHSTAEEVTAEIDLGGKLAVVTGCTSGIGFETMRVLAMRGAIVAGTSRSLAKAQEACDKVHGVTIPLRLELSDLDSVVACANEIRAINQPLDILICNAGYFGGSGKPELINGIEKHFAINHLGHFVLANRLLGRLYRAPQGRIVVVSSRAAYSRAPAAGIEFDNLDGHREYSDFRFYGQSKLANALFVLELGERLKGTRIMANALHPGVINTEIDRHMNRFMQAGFALATTFGYGKSIGQGAATTCFVATSPLLSSTSGKYFEDCNAVTVVDEGHIHNESMARQLWKVSADVTRDYLVIHDEPIENEFERALREQ